MRKDKELSEVVENNSTSMIELRNNNSTIIYISLLPFLSVLAVILTGLVNNTDIIVMMKLGIMVFLLTTAMTFFIRIHDNILNIKYSKSITLIMYLLPILIIMLLEGPEIYSFWMIGGLLIAMLVDNKLGLLVYFNHIFLLTITSRLEPEATIHFLIMGILLVLLSSSLKNKATVIYASIILLSSNTTLSFIMNNFIFNENNDVNYLTSFFSILAVLVTAFLLSCIYNKHVNKYNISQEYITGLKDTESPGQNVLENKEEDDKLNINSQILFDKSTRASYDILLSDNNELLLKIKKYSKALYNHSIMIGDLSGRAANAIGANEDLAKAGGYYHEVGKISGKNYIDEGLKLADEYAFPDELRLILRQHNIKYDRPTSVESAIVMMSDNVASTIEYIEKSGDQRFTSDKIIDNIFKMRMDKGTFDDSGLSIKDFKRLKEFYQHEYKIKVMQS